MSMRLHSPTKLLRLWLGCALLWAAGLACAQSASPQIDAPTYTIPSPQRLSHWLQAHSATLKDTEPLGLVWATPEEQGLKERQRQYDVRRLGRSLWQPQQSPVWRWLMQTPASGRVVLSAAEPAWLEGVPARDPVLRPGDQLWPAQAAHTVHVLDGSGQGCTLAHQAGAYPQDYVSACGLPASGSVWLVQPDGRVKQHHLDAWRPEPLPQPAPGATLWLGWPRSLFWQNPDVAELQELDRRMAQWLAQARPGDGPALATVPSTPARVTPSAASEDWTGLQGARFTPQPSTSQWGVVGLMQTPTARMRSPGTFGLSVMNTAPDTWVNVMLQPLDWLEGGFRYVSVSNRLYGPAAFSGSQSYKDKSFEIKARLLAESDWRPAVALGIRDLGGTGLFGGEYLVTSKRWGRLDASLGLGWGYVGSRGVWRNPLSLISPKMDTRVNDTGVGGSLSTQAYFRGRVAPFGGLEYQSPWRTTFKLEYNGNNYQNEPQGNNQVLRSPINLGLVYHWAPGMDLHASWERGTTLGIGVSLWTDLSGLNTPKLTDKPAPAVSLAYPAQNADLDKTLADIEAYTQWQVRQIERQGQTLGIVVEKSQEGYLQPRLDKLMRVVHRDSTADIQDVQVRHWAAGDVLAVDHMNRAQWLQAQTEPARTSEPAAPFEREWPAAGRYNSAQTPAPASTDLRPRQGKAWDLNTGLSLRQSLGGPDAFVLYKFSVNLTGEVRLPLDVQLHGVAEARVLSNYDRFRNGSSSLLPRVRTYMREYETTSYVTLPRLYAIRTLRLSDSWTASAYGGLLESMYAGAGTELLYRPRGSPWAVGVDVNRVQQREFAQDLRLRDYKANTGHLTTYWEMPWQGLVGTLSVGQYLAGDRGATLSVARTFNNGSSMGAFVTKTNVSAQQFGEGSFNKGVYWSIPFDAFMTSSSRLRANFAWIPLTRDGGAILARPYQLYNETGNLSPRASSFAPALPKERIPDAQ